MKTKLKHILGNKLLHKGIGDSAYYLVANVGSKAIGFLIIPILARAVSIEEFANYDLFLIIAAFFQIIVTLGLDSGVTILMAENQNNDNTLSFLYVTTLLMSMGMLLSVSILLYTYFQFFHTLFSLPKSLWQLIVAYILFNIITYHTFNFLRWRTEAKKAAFTNLFAYLAGIVIGLFFLYTDASIHSYLTGLVIGTSFGALFSLFMARNYLLKFQIHPASTALLRDLLRLSLPFIPNYIGNNLMQMADRVVILMLFGKYELGIYAVIMRLAAIPQFLAGTVTGGFLPVMYNNYKEANGRHLIRNFFNVYLLMIPILFLLFYVVSTPLVGLFGGEAYMKAAYLLPMALVSILFVNGTQGIGFGYTIKRKTHYIMYITFLSVALNFLFSILFGYFSDIGGVIFGTLIAGVIRVWMHTVYSEKLYPFHYNYRLLASTAAVTLLLSGYTLLFH